MIRSRVTALAVTVRLVVINFWTAAGTVLAVLAILVSVILWRLGPPRRKPVLFARSGPVSLSTDRSPGAGSHYPITLNLMNRTRWDIRSDDFDAGEPLVIELNAQIVELLHIRYAAQNVLDAVETGADTIRIHPTKFGSKELLAIEIVVDQEPVITCLNPLVGVKIIRHTDHPPSEAWYLDMSARTGRRAAQFHTFIFGPRNWD